MPQRPKFSIVCEAKDNQAVIRIDGYISDWNNHAAGFRMKLNSIIDQGIKEATVYINTPGGDCFQANEIGNEIAKFPGAVTGELGALCASAGTYISSRCSYVRAARNVSYMIHKPWGYFSGNSDELKSNLKQLINLEAEYLKTYSEKTGLSPDEIKTMWQHDYWMNADEAKEKGFIDEITGEGEITQEDVEAIAYYKNAPKITASITQTDTSKNQQIMSKILYAAMGLPDNTTEAQALAKFEEYKGEAAKAAEYKQKLDAVTASAQKAAIDAVITSGLRDKKFAAAQEVYYRKQLCDNFDETKAHIESLPSAVQLSSLGKGNEGKKTSEDRSNWTYADYQEKDFKALAELEQNEPEKFQQLAEAHYKRKF